MNCNYVNTFNSANNPSINLNKIFSKSTDMFNLFLICLIPILSNLVSLTRCRTEEWRIQLAIIAIIIALNIAIKSFPSLQIRLT